METPAEDDFNQLVELTALAFRVPWAAINFVDEYRAWRKAAYPADQRREAPRAISFCGQAIENAGVTVVPDATTDPCFAHFPSVTGGAKVRFYAGAPLITADGYRVGTICILDSVPRELDDVQVELLRGFAREAMHKVEARLQSARSNDLSRQLGKVITSSQAGVVVCGIDGRVVSCNPVAAQITGWTEEELVGKTLPFTPNGREKGFEKLLDILKRGDTVVLQRSALKRKNGDVIRVRVSSAPLFSSEGTVIGFVSVGEDVGAMALSEQRASVLEAAVLGAFSRAVFVTTAEREGDAKIVYANATFTELYGFDASEVIGRSERILWGDADDIVATAKILAARRAQTPLTVETLHRRKNGQGFWCELGLTPVVDPDGRCRHWVAFANDVTARRRSDQLQRDRLAVAEMMTGNATPERVLHALAIAGERACPEARVEIHVRGSGFRAIDLPRTDEAEADGLADETTWSSPVEVAEQICGTFSFRAPLDFQPTAEDRRLCNELANLAGVAIERSSDHHRLEFLALHDTLTGLPSRTAFEDRLRRTLASAASAGSKVAVAIVDIDRFKAINETLGTSLGDRVLGRAGVRLGSATRSGDVVARFGGDEFAILLTGLADRDAAVERANAIASVLDGEFDFDGRKVRVRYSMGLCLFPDDATEYDQLLAYSTAAMYRQKVANRSVAFPDGDR